MIILRKYLKWLLFSGIFSLLPVIITALKISLRNGNISFGESIIQVITEGGFFLVTALLSAQAIGDLIFTRIFPILRLVTGFGALMVVIISIFLYAEVTNLLENNISYNQQFSFAGTIYILSFTVLFCTSSIILEAINDE
jgi:hypothetical protein